MTQKKHHEPVTIVHDPEVKHFHSRLDGGWLPIPDDILSILGWKEGTDLEIVSVYGNQIVVRRKGALRDGA